MANDDEVKIDYGQCPICLKNVVEAYATISQDDGVSVTRYFICDSVCSIFWDSLGFTGQQKWFGLSGDEKRRCFNEVSEGIRANRRRNWSPRIPVTD